MHTSTPASASKSPSASSIFWCGHMPLEGPDLAAEQVHQQDVLAGHLDVADVAFPQLTEVRRVLPAQAATAPIPARIHAYTTSSTSSGGKRRLRPPWPRPRGTCPGSGPASAGPARPPGARPRGSAIFCATTVIGSSVSTGTRSDHEVAFEDALDGKQCHRHSSPVSGRPGPACGPGVAGGVLAAFLGGQAHVGERAAEVRRLDQPAEEAVDEAQVALEPAAGSARRSTCTARNRRCTCVPPGQAAAAAGLFR